jgi:hypothetical protein
LPAEGSPKGGEAKFLERARLLIGIVQTALRLVSVAPQNLGRHLQTTALTTSADILVDVVEWSGPSQMIAMSGGLFSYCDSRNDDSSWPICVKALCRAVVVGLLK